MAQTSITLDELYNIVKNIKVKPTPTELWTNSTGDTQLPNNYKCNLSKAYSDFDIIQIEFGDVGIDLNFTTLFTKDIVLRHEYVQFTPDRNDMNGNSGYAYCSHSWCLYTFRDTLTVEIIQNLYNPIRRIVGYTFSTVLGGGVLLLKGLLSKKESDLNVC